MKADINVSEVISIFKKIQEQPERIFEMIRVEFRQRLSFIFLTGISAHNLSMISAKRIGRKISPTEVRNANKDLIEAVEKWRTRDLSEERIRYIFLDSVNFDMRIDGSIEKVPVLVAIGVTETGQKRGLGFQAGDKESPSTWREFFKDLKGRGLNRKLDSTKEVCPWQRGKNTIKCLKERLSVSHFKRADHAPQLKEIWEPVQTWFPGGSKSFRKILSFLSLARVR